MLTARYVAIGRVAVTMVAGATGFPRRRFVALTLIAGVSWVSYVVIVDVLAGTWAQDNQLLSIGLAVVITIAGGYLIERSITILERRRDLQRDAADQTGS